MGLRQLLDNPSGGQTFSALVAMALLVIVLFGLFFASVWDLLEGRKIGLGQASAMLGSGIGIARLFDFLRSRHAR